MDKVTNYSDSCNDVVSTMSHVLYAFEQVVLSELPNIAIIYDEALSYETAMKRFYAHDASGQDPLPMFAYNRSVARPSENAPARKGRNYTGYVKTESGSVTYGASFDEFDLNFMYITKSVELLEKFEVTYNSDEGISGSKELIVNMADLGEFKYFLDYQDLTDTQFESEGIFYKTLIGSITIRGFYFTFRATGGIIKDIETRILALQDVNNKDASEPVSTTNITE